MFLNETLSWLEDDGIGDLNALKLRRVESGEKLFDLSMINPDLAPARVILDKLLEAAVRPTNHRYAVARGVRKLREAFAEKYRSRFAVSLDPESEVCVTMGCKDALEHALMCLAKPGGKVIVGTPVYPAFISAIRIANLSPVSFPLSESEEEMLASIEVCAAVNRGAVLLLNFPNNPTGVAVSEQFWRRVSEIANQYDLFVINDFAYGEMGFHGAVHSALAQRVNCSRFAEVFSLSKAYSVPGWRVGALVGHEQLVKRLSQLKSHVDYGIFLPIQIASAAALTAGPALADAVTTRYRERAEILGTALARRGWRVQKPQGGASLWCELPQQWTFDARRFALKLVESQGVVGLPGEVFAVPGDMQRYGRMMRFALVAPEGVLSEVAERIARVASSGEALDLAAGASA